MKTPFQSAVWAMTLILSALPLRTLAQACTPRLSISTNPTALGFVTENCSDIIGIINSNPTLADIDGNGRLDHQVFILSTTPKTLNYESIINLL